MTLLLAERTAVGFIMVSLATIKPITRFRRHTCFFLSSTNWSFSWSPNAIRLSEHQVFMLVMQSRVLAQVRKYTRTPPAYTRTPLTLIRGCYLLYIVVVLSKYHQNTRNETKLRINRYGYTIIIK